MNTSSMYNTAVPMIPLISTSQITNKNAQSLLVYGCHTLNMRCVFVATRSEHVDVSFGGNLPLRRLMNKYNKTGKNYQDDVKKILLLIVKHKTFNLCTSGFLDNLIVSDNTDTLETIMSVVDINHVPIDWIPSLLKHGCNNSMINTVIACLKHGRLNLSTMIENVTQLMTPLFSQAGTFANVRNELIFNELITHPTMGVDINALKWLMVRDVNVYKKAFSAMKPYEDVVAFNVLLAHALSLQDQEVGAHGAVNKESVVLYMIEYIKLYSSSKNSVHRYEFKSVKKIPATQPTDANIAPVQTGIVEIVPIVPTNPIDNGIRSTAIVEIDSIFDQNSKIETPTKSPTSRRAPKRTRRVDVFGKECSGCELVDDPMVEVISRASSRRPSVTESNNIADTILITKTTTTSK